MVYAIPEKDQCYLVWQEEKGRRAMMSVALTKAIMSTIPNSKKYGSSSLLIQKIGKCEIDDKELESCTDPHKLNGSNTCVRVSLDISSQVKEGLVWIILYVSLQSLADSSVTSSYPNPRIFCKYKLSTPST